jgi:hypothetical protein
MLECPIALCYIIWQDFDGLQWQARSFVFLFSTEEFSLTCTCAHVYTSLTFTLLGIEQENELFVRIVVD